MIFLIWSGWGLITPVILFGSFGLGAMLSSAVAGPGVTGPRWPVGLTVGAGAALLWYLGRRWNGAPGRELFDKHTGEEVVLKRPSCAEWRSARVAPSTCPSSGIRCRRTASSR